MITLFITVKAITKLNLGHRNKFEMAEKISRRSSPDKAELVISRDDVLQRTAKKCTKNYNARAHSVAVVVSLSVGTHDGTSHCDQSLPCFV